ncbi:MAG: hypothetical protein ACD_79C01375G0009, partial [uncultured bacterium]
TEVCGIKDGIIVLNDIFRFETSEDANGESSFKAVNKPKKLSKFRKAKINLEDKLFC